MSSIDRYLGDFAGDYIARERTPIPPSVLIRPEKGIAFCEGCRLRKPIRGISKKGWRCDDCRALKKGAKKP